MRLTCYNHRGVFRDDGENNKQRETAENQQQAGQCAVANSIPFVSHSSFPPSRLFCVCRYMDLGTHATQLLYAPRPKLHARNGNTGEDNLPNEYSNGRALR